PTITSSNTFGARQHLWSQRNLKSNSHGYPEMVSPRKHLLAFCSNYNRIHEEEGIEIL
uniref:Uncharacterized protein n=1 Tax=Bursaphelenchus xylophilus TaxID=6326 RepID=A0A1I7SPS4_BURXY